MIDINYINKVAFSKNEKPYDIKDLYYDKIKHDGEYLIDNNGNRIGTKGDFNTKLLMDRLLKEGCWDENPRPHYEDGTKAHTLSLNNVVHWTYDLTKGESPLITLRPIAIGKSIGEILWIYQDATTDLDVLKDKYGVTWWDEWDLRDENGNPKRNIGSTYGTIINDYDQMKNLLTELKENPDGRRHIIDMWQLENFKKPHGLKPCAYSNVWNVRHGRDGKDYLDMKLIQRSSDFLVAGCINQMQYLSLMYMVAQATGYTPGTFTWEVENVQIYDRHIKQAVEQLRREPVNCSPYIEVNKDIHDFYDFTPEDVKVKNYPRVLIKEKNPGQKFEKGI